MANRVGTKGQVVIEKEIRNQLGVCPGWLAIQRLAGDHVEIHFAPPEHDRSLAGCLAAYTQKKIPPEQWEAIRQLAWDEPDPETKP